MRYLSTGRYPSGRRVWLWVRTWRWGFQIEVYRACIGWWGSGPCRADRPRLTRWQRKRA